MNRPRMSAGSVAAVLGWCLFFSAYSASGQADPTADPPPPQTVAPQLNVEEILELSILRLAVDGPDRSIETGFWLVRHPEGWQLTPVQTLISHSGPDGVPAPPFAQCATDRDLSEVTKDRLSEALDGTPISEHELLGGSGGTTLVIRTGEGLFRSHLECDDLWVASAEHAAERGVSRDLCQMASRLVSLATTSSCPPDDAAACLPAVSPMEGFLIPISHEEASRLEQAAETSSEPAATCEFPR